MKLLPNDIRYIIIPDVHGRNFWKSITQYIETNPNINIIFLGDYLDPYPYEKISFKESIDNFKEIISFASENKNNVILLVGNHDMSYIGRRYICQCRHNDKYHLEVQDLFCDNASLFKIYHMIKEMTTDKHLLFSHSVLSKPYYEHCTDLPGKDLNTFVINQNMLLYEALTGTGTNKEMDAFYNNLALISYERGGDDEFGSSIWEDFLMFYKDDSIWINDVDMIVGHTQLENKPIKLFNTALNTWAINLDCRKPFILTIYDTITDMNGDVDIQNINI